MGGQFDSTVRASFRSSDRGYRDTWICAYTRIHIQHISSVAGRVRGARISVAVRTQTQGICPIYLSAPSTRAVEREADLSLSYLLTHIFD